MFFRRHTLPVPSVEQRLASLQSAGFQSRSTGDSKFQVTRGNCLAEITFRGAEARIDRSGIRVGEELASLTDEGFMKTLVTPGGERKPALTDRLRELQDFRQDVREALGLTSLYNESLGTVCDSHSYDRLSGR